MSSGFHIAQLEYLPYLSPISFNLFIDIIVRTFYTGELISRQRGGDIHVWFNCRWRDAATLPNLASGNMFDRMKTESDLTQFPYREQEPLQGNEQLYFDNRKHEATVLDFWKWSASDLLSNATRGRFAEFIVALALGISFEKIRDEWGAYDLKTPEGTKVEVKSAAYIQSWHQQKESDISFRVPKTRAWDPRTNKQELESRRQANVYVFALLAHRDQRTIDPLNLDQWHFYVLPTSVLDARTRSQHSITLKTLNGLSGGPISFADLRQAVLRAYPVGR